MLEINLSIKNTEKQILDIILKETVLILNKKFNRRIIRNITTSIKGLLESAIKNTPEYQSMLSGQLMGELGLVDPDLKLNSIIDIWLDGVFIVFDPIKKQGNKLTGGFTLYAVESNYDDVLSSPYAVQETEKGQKLTWLDWMLTFGDSRFIINYGIRNNPRHSRTGTVIMYPTTKRSWGVPPQFAGTRDNNFITRAIDSIETDIYNIIFSAMG